jgi:hypothetical protein
MRIFNDAEKFEPEAMDKIQQACGIKEYWVFSIKVRQRAV